MENCLFCKFVSGEISKDFRYQDDVAVAFDDIHPKAPVHILVIPRKHVANLDDLDDQVLAGQMINAVRKAAEAAGVKGAYRVQINNGKPVGQLVEHLHIHILGGRQMTD